MERRELLTLFGVGAAGLMAGGAAKADDDDKKDGDKKGEDKHHHLKVMGACAAICNAVSAHCLEELKKGDGEHREEHAKIACATNDCQEFCAMTAALMARHSKMLDYAHKACADACRDCAAACEKSPHELVKKCAEICRECEKLCRGAVGKPAA